MTINHVTLAEGNTPRVFVFTVSISSAPSVPVAISYSTSNGIATSPVDYVAVTNGFITFAAGSVSPQTIAITVNGDVLPEDNETFTVTLAPTVGVLIAGGGQGIGTILNDD